MGTPSFAEVQGLLGNLSICRALLEEATIAEQQAQARRVRAEEGVEEACNPLQNAVRRILGPDVLLTVMEQRYPEKPEMLTRLAGICGPKGGEACLPVDSTEFITMFLNRDPAGEITCRAEYRPLEALTPEETRGSAIEVARRFAISAGIVAPVSVTEVAKG